MIHLFISHKQLIEDNRMIMLILGTVLYRKIKVSTLLTEQRANLGPKADLADLLSMRQHTRDR